MRCNAGNTCLFYEGVANHLSKGRQGEANMANTYARKIDNVSGLKWEGVGVPVTWEIDVRGPPSLGSRSPLHSRRRRRRQQHYVHCRPWSHLRHLKLTLYRRRCISYNILLIDLQPLLPRRSTQEKNHQGSSIHHERLQSIAFTMLSFVHQHRSGNILQSIKIPTRYVLSSITVFSTGVITFTWYFSKEHLKEKSQTRAS